MASVITRRSVHNLCQYILIHPRACVITHPTVYVAVVKQKRQKIPESQLSLRRSSSTAAKMQAWQIKKYGNIDQLTLNTSAQAAAIKSPNELLIKIHASSINPIDLRMLGGYGRTIINILRRKNGVVTSGTEFPLTLGRDFSGTVIETGKAVKKFQVGDEVWGALGAERPGTHAKYTVVSEDDISRKPENLSHIEAASMPYVIATTWAALCSTGQLDERKAARKRILVLGGSGGIGTFAIQLTKAWGMHVVATCSTDAVELVTSLGAQVIDYKTKNVWDELKRVEKFDYILDTIGGDNTNKAFPFLKSWHNAHLITLVSPLLKNSDRLGLVPGLLRSAVSAGVDTLKGLPSGTSLRWAVFIPNGAAMERVRQMVEAGQVKPIVQQVFPFTEVPAAFKKVSGGHLRGKIVVDTLLYS